MPRPIGVVVDDLQLDAKTGIRRAAELGFRTVEVGVARGELAPENLSATGRRHLARYVHDFGLNLGALLGDVGGARFADADRLEENLDRTRRILELAADLRVPVVAGRIGGFDENVPPDQRDRVVEAVHQIADYADRTGTVFALDGGADRPEALQALIKGIDCSLIRACVDPAELVSGGRDPVEAVEALADNVVLARVRDAYAGSSGHPGRETALGQGQVDLVRYLAALEAAGSNSPPVLRRLDTERPIEAIAADKAYLESLFIG